MNPAQVLDFARDYTADRGWSTIPLPFKEKGPNIPGWQNLRIEADKLPTYFNARPLNLGVLLGSPSRNLADDDLDCQEAIRLAPLFLPPTHSKFGRKSKRFSHWLYETTDECRTEQFADPEGNMLVELRSTGGQTMFPPSVHPSGEQVTWDEDGERAGVDATILRRATAELATACILARYWPEKGSRHDATLAAAGFLMKGGVEERTAVKVILAAARVAGDEEAEKRDRDIRTTAVKLANGEAVTGGRALADLLRGDGAKVVAKVREWLGLELELVAPNDIAHAERFIAQSGREFLYCHAWKCWLHWDGLRWRRDEAGVVKEYAKKVAETWYDDANNSTGKQRSELLRWAKYACSSPGINNMLSLAQSSLPISPDKLDVNPWLYTCQSGTLDLRTGELRQPRPEDLITKLSPVSYAKGLRDKIWEELFLASNFPDPEIRAFVRRYAGYCLTGDTSENRFVFSIGPSGSGKSTLLDALRGVMGDYAQSADFSTFLTKRFVNSSGPTEDVARLAGARLVMAIETEDSARVAVGLLKKMTGGDPLTARKLHENSSEFKPQFKLWFASNERPRMKFDDDAMWFRTTELSHTVGRKPEERDLSIKKYVTDPEKAGAAILAWAVEGCLEWQRDGLQVPEALAKTTDAYRQSQHPLNGFVEDCCVLGPGQRVTSGDLRKAYEGWCDENGVKLQFRLKGKSWGAALRKLECTDKRLDGGTSRWWFGIGLSQGADEGGRM